MRIRSRTRKRYSRYNNKPKKRYNILSSKTLRNKKKIYGYKKRPIKINQKEENTDNVSDKNYSSNYNKPNVMYQKSYFRPNRYTMRFRRNRRQPYRIMRFNNSKSRKVKNRFKPYNNYYSRGRNNNYRRRYNNLSKHNKNNITIDSKINLDDDPTFEDWSEVFQNTGYI